MNDELRDVSSTLSGADESDLLEEEPNEEFPDDAREETLDDMDGHVLLPEHLPRSDVL